MRLRFQARRASLSARGLDRLLRSATSCTSAMPLPVIERIADHAGAGRYSLQPARLWEDISSGHKA